ncbi:MAG TPA: metallophosphoesterase family protein [Anaerolineaceae bacterium]|nr:metallophosphoesterase family protein [Anaerolineaceae bacterium]
MRVLIISDIHGNLPALDAVLQDANPVDATWCLGDLVGYGPNPNECIERVRSLPKSICVLGNHDAAALGQIDLQAFNREARFSARWTQEHLSPESLEFLRNLPEVVQYGDVTLTHGSPRNPVWEYLLDTNTATINFEYFGTKICLVGHTHLPIVYYAPNGNQKTEWNIIKVGEPTKITRRAIINPGSVGQPRDHDPRAAYAIFDPLENIWEARRLIYDVSETQKRIYAAGLPERHAIRLAEGW